MVDWRRVWDFLVEYWAAVCLVGIGGWKTTEVVQVLTGESNAWPVRVLVGLVYFGPFIAAELSSPHVRSGLLKLTRLVLIAVLVLAIVAESLRSGRTVIQERLEYERLSTIARAIEVFQRKRLDQIKRSYDELLVEFQCRKSKRRTAFDPSRCQLYWKERDEVLAFPELYRVTPHHSAALAAHLQGRLDDLIRLERRRPSDKRDIVEQVPVFDLAPNFHGSADMVTWLSLNATKRDAEPLLLHVGRGFVMLLLTLIVSRFHDARTAPRPPAAPAMLPPVEMVLTGIPNAVGTELRTGAPTSPPSTPGTSHPARHLPSRK